LRVPKYWSWTSFYYYSYFPFSNSFSSVCWLPITNITVYTSKKSYEQAVKITCSSGMDIINIKISVECWKLFPVPYIACGTIRCQNRPTSGLHKEFRAVCFHAKWSGVVCEDTERSPCSRWDIFESLHIPTNVMVEGVCEFPRYVYANAGAPRFTR